MAISVTASHVAESYDSGNMKADVSDIIFNIDPSETPLLSNMGTRDVANTTFEWNVEDLPSSGVTNKKKEGADFTSEAVTQVTRKTNVTQISSRNATVTGTMTAVSQYGKQSEMAHQMMLVSKALKLDIDKAIGSHNKQEAGAGDQASSSERQTQSLTHQISRGNNVVVKSSGGTTVPSSDTGAYTEGSGAESLTETYFVDVAEKIYENGGKLDSVICTPAVKREISDFTGRGGTQVIVDETKVTSNVTLFASDFGNVKVMISRNLDTYGSSGAAGCDLLFVDFSMAKVAFLRPFTRQNIAKQGDSDSEQILAEWGVMLSNPDSAGVRHNLSNTYS